MNFEQFTDGLGLGIAHFFIGFLKADCRISVLIECRLESFCHAVFIVDGRAGHVKNGQLDLRHATFMDFGPCTKGRFMQNMIPLSSAKPTQ